MRDRLDGVRRTVLRRSPGLGPHAKIPRLESCKPKVGLRTPLVAHSCKLAINPRIERWLPSREERKWLPSRAASTSVLPGACRPQRCPSARSVRTRPNVTFPPSSARASATSRRFCRVLFIFGRSGARLAGVTGSRRWRQRAALESIDGVTALVRRRRASAS